MTRASEHKEVFLLKVQTIAPMPRPTNKQDLLMSTLTLYFRSKPELERFLNTVKGKTNISLRLIDWFVTNYSKKENIMFPLDTTVCGKTKVIQFIVHTSYKSQLKAYSKRHFDPFCRGENIRFYYEDDKSILTTVGQLNFFRWLMSNKILDYISHNLTEIETDMTKNMKTSERTHKKDAEVQSEVQLVSSSTKPQRKQLSVSATRTMLKHDVKLVVNFT